MAIIGQDIREAVHLLKREQLVAIPTETVYGLAGNGFSEKALLDIFAVKKRPKFDPLILHTDSPAKVRELVKHLPDRAELLAQKFWPGPLTLLLEKKASIPDLATAGLPRVAVRIPSHPLALSLLRELDFPLAAPSANPFGYVSPTTARHVSDQLDAKIPYILDGGSCTVGIESTIVGFDGETPVIYRLGGIGREQIEQVVGPVGMELNQSSNPGAPGMLKIHYAPGKPVQVGDVSVLLTANRDRRVGVLAFTTRYNENDCSLQFQLSPQGSLEEAASQLFAALRLLDQSDVDVIVAERFPEEGLGRAINDRLSRAACA